MKKEFREDLYYRINVINIESPMLIERMEDFEDFVFYFSRKVKANFTHSAIAAMKAHAWPGNIRELKNTISRAAALYPKQPITPVEVSSLISLPPKDTEASERQKAMPMIKQMEKEIIVKALLANSGNQRQAAVELGMPKSTLHDRIRHFEINPKDYRLRSF